MSETLFNYPRYFPPRDQTSRIYSLLSGSNSVNGQQILYFQNFTAVGAVQKQIYNLNASNHNKKQLSKLNPYTTTNFGCSLGEKKERRINLEQR